MSLETIIVIALDGKAEFLEVDTSDDVPPLHLTTEDGRTFVFIDWCGQFNGPSIPVYEEVRLK